MERTFRFGEDHLSIGLAKDLAEHKVQGMFSADTLAKISQSQQFVQEIAQGEEAVYGINTGFGPLCTTRISPPETVTLQLNLIRSHSVGVGEFIPPEITRLILLTKIHALAQGYSGLSFETIERLLWHLDQDCLPAIPSQGSVGASGDLAPLAHMALCLIGEGQVFWKGNLTDTSKVLQAQGLAPLSLKAKEGLALINGTQFILAYAVEVCAMFFNLLETADIIGALSLDAFEGSVRPFLEILHQLRPYSGSRLVAQRLTRLLQGSEILESHQDCARVQDPYSFRCMPPVHGASRNAWLHLKQITEIELNSVTDNPIIVGRGQALSGGNFHGQPLALPLDYAALAAAELGNISDRRSYLLLEGKYGLPKLLMQDVGLKSGFMIPQYTSAALVSENKTLCFPASADSIPTSLGQEDHVSMGAFSGRKAWMILKNIENILAVELLYAGQALDFRRPLRSGFLLEVLHTHLRDFVAFAEDDRILYPDIQRIQQEIHQESIRLLINQKAWESGIHLHEDFEEMLLD
ncbi:MAG: histidine ammonia-lyase [Microscillaceae bacterium]|nr:histidine ammonia-lyase [Microscillaceae bacterium]